MALVVALLLPLTYTPGVEVVPVNPGDLLVADVGLGGVIRVDAAGNQTVSGGRQLQRQLQWPHVIAVGFAPSGTSFAVDSGCCVNVSMGQRTPP